MQLLEQSTWGQAGNKLWFHHREGHVTASLFKAAAKTNPCMPAQSLIKRICYPQAFNFSSESTSCVSRMK